MLIAHSWLLFLVMALDLGSAPYALPGNYLGRMARVLPQPLATENGREGAPRSVPDTELSNTGSSDVPVEEVKEEGGSLVVADNPAHHRPVLPANIEDRQQDL